MNEMINKIGERMVIKARLVNQVLEKWLTDGLDTPLRNNPFYSEFQGMRQLLKAMDMEFSIELDDDFYVVAIVIMGKTFAV